MGKRAPIKPLPTADRLRELLEYDKLTGVLTWRVHQGSMAAGRVAGTLGAKGHRMVRVDGRFYLAHRLIWKIVSGADPAQQIDHVDGDRDHNAWSNLREATHGQNRANSRLNRNNTSGFKGVTWAKDQRKWRALVSFKGKIHHIGYFDSAEVAARERSIAATRIQGEFARAA